MSHGTATRRVVRKQRGDSHTQKGVFGSLAVSGGGMSYSRSTSGVEVKGIGPTDADKTFFQSVRLKLANNPLSQPFAQHPIVYACVHALASNLCNTRWLTRPAGVEKGKPVNNELSRLVDDPNPLMSTADFFYFISVWLSLSGECLIVKEGKNERLHNVSEVPAELWPLNGRLFKHVVNEKTRLIDYWVMNDGTKDETVYKPEEVIHVRYPNPYDPYRGLPPMAAANQAAMTDWLAILYNEAYFKNGGDPGGILTYDGTLNETRRLELEQRWADRHTGANKAKRLAVLDRGMKYDSVATSHRDMEFTTQREWNRSEIMSVFRVPPAEAGFYEDVNNATAQEESKRFWTRTMFPIMRIVEDAMWSGLFRWVLDGKYVGRFDRESVPELQAALKEQIDSAKALMDMGATAEQAFAKVGIDMPINEWQKKAWTNGNQVDFDSLDIEGETPPMPKTAFNAQMVSTAKDLAIAVAGGQLGWAAAVAQMVQFFPGVDEETAKKMIGAPPAVSPPASGQPTGSSPPPAPAPAAPPADAALRSLSGRTPESRRIYWKELHETHYGPAESKFRGMVKRWMMSLRAEQLRIIDAHPKMFAAGKVCLNFVGKADSEKVSGILFDTEKWRKAIGEASRPHYRRVVLAAQKRLAKEIGAATEWSADDKIVKNLTESLGDRVTDITETIRTRLREGLGDVIAKGGGVKDAQEVVKHTLKVSLARSLTIARTEVGAASNRATFIAAREEGVKQLEWVSAGDELVRESHQIDGETVDIGEEFSNGLRHPHDPEGDAEEVINCRCDVAPVVDEGLEDTVDEADVLADADLEERRAFLKEKRKLALDEKRAKIERLKRPAPRPAEKKIEVHAHTHVAPPNTKVEVKAGDVHVPPANPTPIEVKNAITVPPANPTPVEVKTTVEAPPPAPAPTVQVINQVNPTPVEVKSTINVDATKGPVKKVTEFIEDGTGKVIGSETIETSLDEGEGE